jgi:hypothetical protein
MCFFVYLCYFSTKVCLLYIVSQVIRYAESFSDCFRPPGGRIIETGVINDLFCCGLVSLVLTSILFYPYMTHLVHSRPPKVPKKVKKWCFSLIFSFAYFRISLVLALVLKNFGSSLLFLYFHIIVLDIF